MAVNWNHCKQDTMKKQDRVVVLFYHHGLPGNWAVKVRFADKPPRIVIDCRLKTRDGRRLEAFGCYGSCVAKPTDEELALIAARVAEVSKGVQMNPKRVWLNRREYKENPGLVRYELRLDYKEYDG